MEHPRDALQAPSHPDPYPWYAQLRGTRPLYLDAGLRLWVASSAAAVREALLHPSLRVRPPAEPVPAALVGRPAGEVFAQLVRMTDGEFHAQHRPAVATGAARWSEADVAAAAGEAAQDLAARVDANALLSALPVQAMARLLGVSAPERDRTVAWVHDFTQGIAAGAGGDQLERADAAALALMAQGEREGLPRVRAANRIAFMQQALDATAGLVGNTVHLLARREDLLEEARTPAGMTAIVSEVARWDPPVHNTRRFAAADVVLQGQRVAAGEGLLLLLAAANRDPELNPEPDDFRCGRAGSQNLAFGAGVHACPGERLAITIAAAGLHALQARQPLGQWFGAVCGWRPLANARIPVFSMQ